MGTGQRDLPVWRTTKDAASHHRGNAFHNAPEALGQIPPAVAQALYRCKLIRVPFSEMLALARIPAIYARLQLPPIIGFLETVAPSRD
ncbi:MAG: hypothetical protein IPO15_13475 [Anaerolineae bacterium]|uniref:hypothetical protein n=1 Tax=Candidatus Amarolinea dominans TaxID=3140696 RepID=UPI0031356B99|nr:hypothetical protein [Anaerolineae bacterium]